MEKKFTASLNTTSKVITTAVVAFSAYLSFFMTRDLVEEEIPFLLTWVMPLFLIAVCAGLFLYRPLGYSITPYSFVVRRLVKDVVVDRQQIEFIRTVSKEEMGLPIRTFGNGGLFGFTGKYFSDRFGKMTWYATRTSNYVLVQLNDGKKLIITPDEPQELVKQWQ